MQFFPWLLVVCGVAAFRSIKELPKDVGDYTISRLGRTGKASKAPSELKITDNILNLTRATSGASISSTYVQAMRKHGLSRATRATNGSTALQAVEGGAVFLAGITVGGQDFSVVIDTGSSDPWLVVEDFQCYDYYDDSPEDQAYCEFGPPYVESSTYRAISNQNFNISYADGEYLTGSMGYETFQMAGIAVPNQKFGLVDQAAWSGDTYSSGLVGFAYRTLTSAHAGSDPRMNRPGDTIMYNPLFVNMYTNEGVPPVFSMAIDRDLSKGGVMALGGIPNIPHAPVYASAAIEAVGINITSGALVYEFYTIEIDGYAVSDSNSTQFNPFNNTNPLKTPLIATNTDVIVDSGTSLCYLPDDVARSVSMSFDPPAYMDPEDPSDMWMVDCDATAPVFGVSIGNKIFYVNPLDMVIPISATECISGVQSDEDGLTILGGTWMKNVIAVFDIGAERMHFAAREYYSTS